MEITTLFRLVDYPQDFKDTFTAVLKDYIWAFPLEGIELGLAKARDLVLAWWNEIKEGKQASLIFSLFDLEFLHVYATNGYGEGIGAKAFRVDSGEELSEINTSGIHVIVFDVGRAVWFYLQEKEEEKQQNQRNS